MSNDEMKTPEYLKLEYIDNCIEQTLLWINGKSVHKNNECTMDFSCCHPEFLQPDEQRLKNGQKKIDDLTERRNSIINPHNTNRG